MVTSRPRISLKVVRADGGHEASAVMTGNTLSCGQQGNLALTDDPFLAATQVRFSFENGVLTAEDVGGGNGTFLRLRAETELAPGTEVRVGRQRLRLEVVPPPAPAPDGTLAWGSPDGGAAYRLVQFLEGGVQANAYMLKPGATLLGRDAGDIVFPTDGFISGRHASLEVKANRVTVKDLGSSNGTFVRLVRPVPVENGDQFLVGRELIRVEIAR